MRIRKFKYFESNEYYHELTKSEADDIFSIDHDFTPEDYDEKDSSEDFNKSEIDYIRDFVPKKYTVVNILGSEDVIHINDDNNYGNKIIYTIIKLKDEWFIFTVNDLDVDDYGFKCDQLVGLKKCFIENAYD